MSFADRLMNAWRGGETQVRHLVRRAGFDVVRYHHTSHPVARLLRLFEHYGVGQVFDVGASGGQYGIFIRKSGYHGKLVSFEPVTEPFAALQSWAVGDPNWTAVNLGLGDFDGESTINVSANSECSSFLPVLSALSDAMPTASYVGSQTIQVRTIDSIFDQYATPDVPLFVKLDTQGFERRIIEGARRSLPKICGFQAELSVTPLYEGETPLAEMLGYMKGLGYELMGVQPGYSVEATGQMLQIDGLFFRP